MRKPTPYAHAMAWQVCRLLKMISSVCMALDMFSGGKKWKGFDKFLGVGFFWLIPKLEAILPTIDKLKS